MSVAILNTADVSKNVKYIAELFLYIMVVKMFSKYKNIYGKM